MYPKYDILCPKFQDGMVLGGHSVSSSFRLRKKRGSFRLKRIPTEAHAVPSSMKYLPLSYIDTYYALGNARNRLSDDIYLGSPSTMIQEDPNYNTTMGCFVNEDSVCPKIKSSKYPGLYYSIKPCEDPNAPKPRFWEEIEKAIKAIIKWFKSIFS